MDSAPGLVVLTDTSVLINFLHLDRLDLLGKLPGYEFQVPDHVVEEIRDPVEIESYARFHRTLGKNRPLVVPSSGCRTPEPDDGEIPHFPSPRVAVCKFHPGYDVHAVPAADSPGHFHRTARGGRFLCRRRGLHPGRSCGANRVGGFRDRGDRLRGPLGMGQGTRDGSAARIDPQGGEDRRTGTFLRTPAEQGQT